MLEYRLIENGDIDDREDGEEGDDDGPEEEFVCVDVFEDVSKADGFAWGKPEEGTFEVFAFPCKEEEGPG